MSAALRVLATLAVCTASFAPLAARADDAPSPKAVLDSVLEKLDFKAKPAAPAPDFVRKTRPDVTGLDYMQRPMPHKVSPIPTKTPDEVQAAKDALDAARERQLAPAAPPVQLATPNPGKPKPARKRPH